MFDPYHGNESQAGPSTSRYRPSAGDRRFNLDTAQDAMAQRGEHSNVRATGIARGDTVDIQENKWTDPVTYEDGVFQGRIVRFLLRCVQEPVSGRRKTEKDRRPLAPVPIIRIWVKECLQDEAGIWTEEDLDTSDVDPSCLICEVQLTAPLTDRAAGGVIESLPTQGPMEGDQVPLLDPSFHIPHPHPSDFARPPLMAYQSFTSTSQVPLNPRQLIQNEQLRYHPPGPQHRASWVADGHWDTHSSAHTGGPEKRPVQHSYRLSGELAPAPATGRSRKMTETDLGSSDDDMSGVGRKKLRRGESRNLYGALHVSGVKVVAPSGEQGFWFLFTDLCVRHEGTYALQFRVFDLSLTQADKPPVPHLADCESGTFKVYSPRSFPGMPKPTELSEHFIRQGYKLNTRKNEKIARSLSPTSPERPSEMNASPSRQESRTTSSTSTNLPA